MSIKDIKLGETYYIIYEFSSSRDPEVKQCICLYKTSEKLSNDKILEKAIVKFKLDSENEVILHESIIDAYVFKTEAEANKALLKLKV